MRKTPIKLVKKQCKGCGEDTYLFSKGFCKYCASKKGKQLTSNNSIKPKSHKSKVKDTELMSYFEHHITTLKAFGRSEESGTTIGYPTNINICHLFPKRTHKSVRGNLDNCIYLTWEEHSKLDNEYLDRYDFKGLEKSFPNSFKLIVERMRLVRLHITEKTKFVEAFDLFNESLTF